MFKQNLKIGAAVLAVLLFGFGQVVKAQPPPKDPDRYIPGLGDLMEGLQVQHNKLWFAGDLLNWPLAAYSVDAIKEGIADMKVLRPRYKGESIVEMLDGLTAKPMQDLEAAVAAQDSAGFVRAYDALSESCNVCHRNHGYGFIAIVRPSVPVLTNQRYEP
tara:strand:- start:59643 stop:60122 length:480 start_codon:yes stop_codon:yes gene_type:complete